jgi:ketosteroid isomerase-like protein
LGIRIASFALGLVMLLLAAAGRLSASAEDEDRTAIRAALERWTENFNAGRVETACDLFARDLRASFRGQPEKTFESLCSSLQKALGDDTKRYRYAFDLHDILVSGEMAAVRLTWHLSVTDRMTGRRETTSDRGLDVFRRAPDGAWRIVRFLGYQE